MASTRKPYLATSYHDMMRHIYAKRRGHSEGLKPWMSDTYTDMEYPQLAGYEPETGVIPPPVPPPPVPPPIEPLPHITIFSCLYYNPLDFCIKCESLSNPNQSLCGEPAPQECIEPCYEFTLPAPTATAPVTICPSDPICIADVAGGLAADGCVYVPDEGCGTKTVSVTDICGNTVSTEVRMSSGTWVLQNTQGPASCAPCTQCGGVPNNCSVISGGTRIDYQSNCHNTAGCPSSLGSSPCVPTCISLGYLYNVINYIYTYIWECP